MNRKNRVLAGLITVAFSASVFAAVSADEAKQLGTTLTPLGAEKAGNKEGTIPAYTGEGVKPPASYDPKDPSRRPDPFANEKPLFSITAQNAAQYADKIDGMVEVFKKYPNFRMDIYPSHRTSTVPKWVQDNTFKNATSCKGVDNELKLDGCHGGLPFPIVKTGAQAMWNHLAAFEAVSWGGLSKGYVVSPNGNATMSAGSTVYEQSWYYEPNKTTPSTGDTIALAVRVDDNAPARRVGQKLIVLDPLDQLSVGRRAWQYIPGQRRVKLAPDLAYDTPSPTGSGVSTMDEAKVFYGSIDRYDWKLVGKKEKFVMGNNFKLFEHTTCTDAVINTPHFPNPDCVRWELRRVWVVEGKLKSGFRHVMPRRVFYWDEDTFQIGNSENYDASGKLYRVDNAISIPYWPSENAGSAGDGSYTLDLQTGNWAVQGSTADPGQGWVMQSVKDKTFFSPEALAGEGIR